MTGIINYARLGLAIRSDPALSHLLKCSYLMTQGRLHRPVHREVSGCCQPLLQKQKALAEHHDSNDNLPSMSVKEKVKETTKTVGYSGIVLGGVGVTAVILYYIFNELFSKDSVNSVYAAALERCAKEPRVADLLGEPIKGFGEETRRGRRTHVSHLLYEKDGLNYLRMKFYLKGSRNQATVSLEMAENKQSGHFEYRYLFVQTDDLARRVVVLEDNRAQTAQYSSSQSPALDLSVLPPPIFPVDSLNK